MVLKYMRVVLRLECPKYDAMELRLACIQAVGVICQQCRFRNEKL